MENCNSGHFFVTMAPGPVLYRISHQTPDVAFITEKVFSLFWPNNTVPVKSLLVLITSDVTVHDDKTEKALLKKILDYFFEKPLM